MLTSMADAPLSILALSAYHGGPRATSVEEYAAHSGHRISQMTLPPRTWPWRLRGSALWFAHEIARLRRRIDLVLASDLVDAARLRALLPPALRAVPIAQVFHDDVLSADLKARPRDEPLAVAQLYSLLTCELATVASDYHRGALLAGARRLVGTFPDAVPVGLVDRVERRLTVCPRGTDVEAIVAAEPRRIGEGPSVILWNHPWVEDQDPRTFFETLAHLDAEGAAFRVVVVGVAVRKYPEVFQQAQKQFSRHIVQFGFVPGREQYLSVLKTADVVVSTARREWFPIGVVEAVAAGAAPLVGRGLASAEVFGDALPSCSYRGPVDLRRKLARLLTDPDRRHAQARAAHEALLPRLGWRQRARALDDLLSTVAARTRQ